MSSDCLFCKIMDGKIPSQKVYENESVYAFKDIHPLAKTHVLFIHRTHSHDVNEFSSNTKALGEVFAAIKMWTEAEGLNKTGFRVVTNLGPHSGQTVFHTHFHVLGGEQLGGFGR